ncbi:vicilin-like seed storage protein At2g18540 [Durio zibethinus]|uniref:Vicilin-like seed storage protein At2g18540 n=1 Tax=Durio zibethinus TaxID=66656 RepID=A0A6P5ZID3_DURZI|nr:vicilin-like seed storage protein At2g18540 [Durio zibethinus]
MLKGTSFFQFSLFTVFYILASFPSVEASLHGNASALGYLVPKHERKHLVLTEYGEISAVKVSDGRRGSYHLQFITMEPNSLFLPVLLHADMVFYIHTGSGTLSWTDDNEMRTVNIRKGDIYRLHPGSFFYLQSSLEPEREKLRIYAIFSSKEENIYEPWIGAYSRISDVVLGFGSKVLQAAFEVPEDVIEEIMKATKPPAIIHAVPKKKKIFFEWQTRLLKAFLGSNRDGFDSINGKKKKKTKAYNVLEADPDFKNCNGWSLTVDKNDLRLLRDSNIGVFMVNLTKGSMMGPHWNSRASEIAVVLEGQGMIRVACSSNANESECKNLRFRVKEGDVFLIPMFHAMAQISFNNDSFVFMGFSTSTNRNYPQFLAGKSSVLGFLDRQILAVSFNVSNTTIDQLLTPQKDSVIFDCTSCAEEEESIMEEEIEREREEEEEARKKEEEDDRKRKEEEEARKKEEEEARKREEEEARKRKEEDEARKKQEEEARKREEEEEEEEKKRREEEARKEQEEARRQEEERQRRARQEEEERKRQEEKEKERRRKEEQEQEEPKRRKGGQGREEAAARKQAKRQEQERQRRAEQEEEEARWER